MGVLGKRRTARSIARPHFMLYAACSCEPSRTSGSAGSRRFTLSGTASAHPRQQQRQQQRHSGPHLGSEDAHVCYKRRPWPPEGAGISPPPGWRPMLPCDDSRLFKGARIAPFGANLALVLYRRRDGGAAPRYVCI